MENAVPEKQSPFATEPIGRLIVRFAVPSVIALLVNSLYNIVDQIFIGWGVGYLGNGATNIVFPITIVALALSMMIGNGGAAYLSLKLGEGKKEEARTSVGNAVSLVCVVSVVLAVVFLLWIDPILTLVRCHRRAAPLRPAVRLHYRPWAALYDDLRRHQLHDPRGRQPQVRMLSMVIGAIINVILDPVLIFIFHMGVQGAAVATVVGQVASFVVSVVYMPRFKTVQLHKNAFLLRAKTCGNIVVFGLSSFITSSPSPS